MALCFLLDCMKMSSAKDISSVLNRSSLEFGSRNYAAWFLAHKQRLKGLQKDSGPT